MDRPKGGGRWRVSVVKPQNLEEARTVNDEYNQQLAEVLRTRDVFKFRNFLAASGRALPQDMMLDPLKMATLMHQLILSVPELAEMHEFSQQWLNDNTFLPKNNSSLNKAAKRAPGAPSVEELPQPSPGRRTISLRPLPPERN